MGELINEKWPFNELSMTDALKVLQENRIIRNCEADEFVLVRDFQNLSVQEIFSWLNYALPQSKDFDSLPSLIVEHLPQIDTLKSSFAGLENAIQKEFSAPIGRFFSK